MTNPIIEDWASGISEPLRRLIALGVDDEELGRFMQARKVGNSDLANQIVAATRSQPTLRDVSGLGTTLDDVLNQIRVAALKPMVNQMEARVLHRYIQCIWQASEAIVWAHRNESFWSSEAAVLAVAEVVMNFSLAQQSAISDPQSAPTPSPPVNAGGR
jgi:hypothetical protein